MVLRGIRIAESRVRFPMSPKIKFLTGQVDETAVRFRLGPKIKIARSKNNFMSFLNHIVIIPDGNRRWAKKRRMPFFFGHREGAKTAEEIFKTAFNLKIPYVTFWGCSVNNVVKRPKLETVFLLKLFEQHFKNIIKDKEIHKNKVKINALGR